MVCPAGEHTHEADFWQMVVTLDNAATCHAIPAACAMLPIDPTAAIPMEGIHPGVTRPTLGTALGTFVLQLNNPQWTLHLGLKDAQVYQGYRIILSWSKIAEQFPGATMTSNGDTVELLLPNAPAPLTFTQSIRPGLYTARAAACGTALTAGAYFIRNTEVCTPTTTEPNPDPPGTDDQSNTIEQENEEEQDSEPEDNLPKDKPPKIPRRITKATRHARYGHGSCACNGNLHKLLKGIGPAPARDPEVLCESCLVMKSRARATKPADKPEREIAPWEDVFWDIAGKFRVRSRESCSKYASIFYCRKTGAMQVYGMRTKNAAGATLHKFNTFVKEQNGATRNIVRLRGDVDTVMHSPEVGEILKQHGITQQDCVEYDHATNGPVERSIQTLFGDVRSMLHCSKLPDDCWLLALEEAARMRCILPNKRTGDNTTPFEMIHGERPDVSNIRAFGSHAWPHITPEQQKARQDNSKLSGPRADRGVLVGNDLRTGLYIVLIKGRITRRTRCVRIDEAPILKAMQNRVAQDLCATSAWLKRKEITHTGAPWLADDAHLSLCSGIDCAAMLANLHHISPAKYYSVETDAACRAMATHASPATENFCGISHVHHDINTITEDHIIAMGKISLVTMGTPCQDFSLLRLLVGPTDRRTARQLRPGLQGERGKLFLQAILIAKWVLKHNPTATILAENVVFQDMTEDWQQICSAFDQVHIVDAINFSCSKRNRGYWTTNLHMPDGFDAPNSAPMDPDTCMDPGRSLQLYQKSDRTHIGTITSSLSNSESEPLPRTRRPVQVIEEGKPGVHYLRPHEAERLLGMRANCTAAPNISPRQRLAALGNAWDIRVLSLFYQQYRIQVAARLKQPSTKEHGNPNTTNNQEQPAQADSTARTPQQNAPPRRSQRLNAEKQTQPTAAPDADHTGGAPDNPDSDDDKHGYAAKPVEHAPKRLTQDINSYMKSNLGRYWDTPALALLTSGPDYLPDCTWEEISGGYTSPSPDAVTELASRDKIAQIYSITQPRPELLFASTTPFAQPVGATQPVGASKPVGAAQPGGAAQSAYSSPAESIYNTPAVLLRTPKSYKEAVFKSPEAQYWVDANLEEIRAHEKNGTFRIIDPSELPPNHNLIHGIWRYRIKQNMETGHVKRFKSRLCARGDHQRPGIDYFESSAPVVAMSTIRTALALATLNDWSIECWDVVTAFLNGTLREDVFMHVPPGLEHYQGQPTAGKILKIEKGLYGLCQAGRTWWKTFDAWLMDSSANPDCKRCSTDTCCYTFTRGNEFVLFLIYVDDLCVIHNSKDYMKTIKERTFSAFKMTDDGDIQDLLGCEINRDRKEGTLKFHQTRYILDMLETFDPDTGHTEFTPMSHENPISMLDCPPPGSPEQTKAQKLPTKSLLGSLLYATKSRPDIVTALSKACSHGGNPGVAHYQAALRILRYLRGTIDLKLTYRRTGGVTPHLFMSPDVKSTARQCKITEDLLAMVDADYAGCPATRRSTSGWLIFLAGAPVSWGSKRQSITATSSAESEYLALVSCCKDLLALRYLLTQMPGTLIDGASRVYEDNSACINMVKNPKGWKRTKHIPPCFHFVRDLAEDEVIDIQYIPTWKQVADIMTKALPPKDFCKFRDRLLGLLPDADILSK